ncbi:hypothetical protein ABW21_db0202690 [Orbilia brochopaga]|nr:hypothetical protein ABW21_db0202690 [Drechslerella brochopaga]
MVGGVQCFRHAWVSFSLRGVTSAATSNRARRIPWAHHFQMTSFHVPRQGIFSFTSSCGEAGPVGVRVFAVSENNRAGKDGWIQCQRTRAGQARAPHDAELLGRI